MLLRRLWFRLLPGSLARLISIEGGLSIYMILATAGISGAGSVALTYFWERITGVKAQ